MNIGIDGRLLNQHHNTGISRYTEFLLEFYIKKYGEDKVSVITNDTSLKIKNCKIVYTKLRPFNLLHFFFYGKFIRRYNFDILHIPFYSGFFVRVPNVKVIVTVHDLMYKLVKGFFGKNSLINYLKIKYFDFIVGCTIKNSSAVISVSETTRQDINKIFKINSIHIPEYSEILGEKDDLILNRLGLQNKNFFFYCGSNRPHKNLQFVIEIFNLTPELPPLVLAGKGHKMSNNVIIADVVTEKELKALYKAAIAFIFPSKYEGFGLPVIEALSEETLVIASRIPAFLEFKTNNIIYFDIDDSGQLLKALKKAEDHKFEPEDFFFEKYDPKVISKQLDLLLDSLHTNKNTKRL